MRAVTLFNVLLLIALVGGSVAVYADLPDRIPVHFGSDGAPDRWADTSWGSWFGLPLTAVVVNVIIYGISSLWERNPRFINFPDKSRLMKLPRERRQVVLVKAKSGVRELALVLTLVFFAVQWGIYRTALGGDARSLIIAALAVGTISTPIVAIRLLYRIQKEIDHQVELERRSGGVGVRP